VPVLDELTQYVITNTTRFKEGGSTGSKVPIFRGRFPANTNDTAVAMFETGGPGPLYLSNGVLSHERPSVQVISRSTSYLTARNNARYVYDVLAGITTKLLPKVTSTGTTTYLTVTPVQSPADMGKDAQERDMITCNYIAEKVVS
jgi:hypothetical protein